MKIYKHIYYHGSSYLCEEWVNDDIEYKIKLDIEKFFYQDESDDTWHTDWGNFEVSRTLHLKMSMWKMVGDEIHYKSSDILDDRKFEKFDEW